MNEKKEYIEKNVFKQELLNKNFYPAIVSHTLENMPNANVVEVVRCKDCKYRSIRTHNKYDNKMICHNLNSGVTGFVNQDFYCPYGERME